MKYFLQTDSKTKMVYLGAPGKGNESADAVMDKRIAEWGTILCFRESEADDIEALCTELYREIGRWRIRFLVINGFRHLGAGRSLRKKRYIIRQLETLARETEIPILLLCRVKRRVERRRDHRPRERDIRDIKALRGSAEEVYLLYRDEYYDPATDAPGVMEITSVKLRRRARETTVIRCDMRDHRVGDFDVSIR